MANKASENSHMREVVWDDNRSNAIWIKHYATKYKRATFDVKHKRKLGPSKNSNLALFVR